MGKTLSGMTNQDAFDRTMRRKALLLSLPEVNEVKLVWRCDFVKQCKEDPTIEQSMDEYFMTNSLPKRASFREAFKVR